MSAVSVVITVYKRYKYVRKAIDSVRTQLNSGEIIVVADSAEEAGKLEGVKVVECRSEYHGECVVRGVQESANNIIFFLEDDDMFVPDKISKVLRVIRDTEAYYVHNLQHYIDEVDRAVSRLSRRAFIYERFQPKRLAMWSNAKELAKLWLKFPAMHHNLSSIAIRRDLVLVNDYVLSKMKSSLDWALTALSYGRGIHVPSRLTYYRLGSGSTSIRGKGRGELERLVTVYERELESKKTFLKLAQVPPELEEYLKFDVYVHNLYLSFLRGSRFDLDLGLYKKFLGSRNKGLVPVELWVQLSLKLSERLYRLSSSLAKAVLGFTV